MDIRFGGVLTKEEFLAAIKLSNRPISPRTRIDLWILLVLAGLALVGIGVWLAFSEQALYPIAFLIFIVGLVLFVIGFKLRATFDQLWDKNDAYRVRRDVTANDDFIEIHNSSGQVQLRWQDFSGYGEYQEVMVLFQGPTISHPFPKRFFLNEMDWPQFKALVVKKLPLTHQVTALERPNLLVWIILILAVIMLLWKLIGSPK